MKTDDVTAPLTTEADGVIHHILTEATKAGLAVTPSKIGQLATLWSADLDKLPPALQRDLVAGRINKPEYSHFFSQAVAAAKSPYSQDQLNAAAAAGVPLPSGTPPAQAFAAAANALKAQYGKKG